MLPPRRPAAIAKQIPDKTAGGFPELIRPTGATDFQLQQAVVLVQAMAAQKSASATDPDASGAFLPGAAQLGGFLSGWRGLVRFGVRCWC